MASYSLVGDPIIIYVSKEHIYTADHKYNISYSNILVTIYAVGDDDQFIEANKLQQLIESNEKDLSTALGYNILSVESNKPTEPPVVTTVTRSIPDWAIALIVIVNSVIVISLLLIVLAILWRRYNR